MKAHAPLSLVIAMGSSKKPMGMGAKKPLPKSDDDIEPDEAKSDIGDELIRAIADKDGAAAYAAVSAMFEMCSAYGHDEEE